MKWILKGCPRCHGDLYLEKNYDGSVTERCLLCGYQKDIEVLVPLAAMDGQGKLKQHPRFEYN